MQGKLFQCKHKTDVEALHGIHLSQKKSMKYSKLSESNAFNLVGYQTNTDASIIVYKFHPERSGFNMYAEYTQLQLTFLALHSWTHSSFRYACIGW